MMDFSLKHSKELSRLNLTMNLDKCTLRTYWCRVAIREVETYMNRLHAHSFFEIHLCLEGSAKFIVEGEKIILKKGGFVFIPRRKMHWISEVSNDFIKLVWGFDVVREPNNAPSELADLYETELDKVRLCDYSQSAETELTAILENLKRKTIGYYTAIKLHLYTLFIELSRLLAPDKDMHGVKRAEETVRIDNITPYILDNLQNGVTVSELAMWFALSERQLQRVCRREFGVSAGQYIRSLEMERSKELLADVNIPISEIASTVGYSDQFSFSKAFKAYEGLSPLAFRLSFLR